MRPCQVRIIKGRPLTTASLRCSVMYDDMRSVSRDDAFVLWARLLKMHMASGYRCAGTSTDTNKLSTNITVAKNGEPRILDPASSLSRAIPHIIDQHPF